MSSKTIVITGAAKAGVGEAITKRILREGYKVIGSYEAEDQENAQSLLTDSMRDGNISLKCVDHSSRKEIQSFIDSISEPISGIVHAQFFFAMEDPERFDHDIWQKSLDVNLTMPNYITHGLKVRLVNNSSVVIITSTEGFIGSFGASAYASSKAAIHNLVKTLANNFGSRSIRVNAIAAGWIGGVMDTDEVFNMSRRITPLGRLGSPDEIASVAWFLLSTESSFVNGTTITADGGYTGVDTIAKYEFDQSF
jgi:NAD(P)-dependent dehydrogenase (short-subunit alcohol dehydrogenase family)